eukprot:5677383-Amphidinium_carterae.2
MPPKLTAAAIADLVRAALNTDSVGNGAATVGWTHLTDVGLAPSERLLVTVAPVHRDGAYRPKTACTIPTWDDLQRSFVLNLGRMSTAVPSLDNRVAVLCAMARAVTDITGSYDWNSKGEFEVATDDTVLENETKVRSAMQ